MQAISWIVVIQTVIAGILVALARSGFKSIRGLTTTWQQLTEGFPKLTKEIKEIKELLERGQSRFDRLEGRLDNVESIVNQHIEHHHRTNSRHG